MQKKDLPKTQHLELDDSTMVCGSTHAAVPLIRPRFTPQCGSAGDGTTAATTEPDPQQPLRCPRCDSTNTKFCYYNNYSLLQPRYFCKNCRRYWTKGGALRNVPVGGGCRKNKRINVKQRPNVTNPTTNIGGGNPIFRPNTLINGLQGEPPDHGMNYFTGIEDGNNAMGLQHNDDQGGMAGYFSRQLASFLTIPHGTSHPAGIGALDSLQGGLIGGGPENHGFLCSGQLSTSTVDLLQPDHHHHHLHPIARTSMSNYDGINSLSLLLDSFHGQTSSNPHGHAGESNIVGEHSWSTDQKDLPTHPREHKVAILGNRNDDNASNPLHFVIPAVEHTREAGSHFMVGQCLPVSGSVPNLKAEEDHHASDMRHSWHTHQLEAGSFSMEAVRGGAAPNESTHASANWEDMSGYYPSHNPSLL